MHHLHPKKASSQRRVLGYVLCDYSAKCHAGKAEQIETSVNPLGGSEVIHHMLSEQN